MKTVVLIMRRASLAQGLMTKIRHIPDMRLCYEPDYTKADVAIRTHLAAGALLEVSEDGANDIGFCLALCAKLRKDRQKLSTVPSRQNEGARSMILSFMMYLWIIWPPVCSLYKRG